MGLNTGNGGSGGNILYVKRGAICLETDRETEGYQHVSGEVDGRPYEKWVQKHDSVDGMITKIYWYDTEEQHQVRYQGLKVDIQDGEDVFILDLPYGTKPYNAFTKFAENLDLTKPVEFCAWPDGESTGFTAKQDGMKVAQKYIKQYVMDHADEPGACPVAVQNTRTQKWNFDEQHEWLLNNVLENVAPKVVQQDMQATHAEPKKTKAKAKAAASDDNWGDGEGPDPIHG